MGRALNRPSLDVLYFQMAVQTDATTTGEIKIVDDVNNANTTATLTIPPSTNGFATFQWLHSSTVGEARWAHYADPDRLPLLAGDTLLHTDLHPDNIIITDTRLVDWAWPTLGAAWVEPACLGLWLIVAGHTPAEAETVPRAWAITHPDAVDTFTTAATRLWQQIADHDPYQPWKARLAAAARWWAEHRRR